MIIYEALLQADGCPRWQKTFTAAPIIAGSSAPCFLQGTRGDLRHWWRQSFHLHAAWMRRESCWSPAAYLQMSESGAAAVLSAPRSLTAHSSARSFKHTEVLLSHRHVLFIIGCLLLCLAPPAALDASASPAVLLSVNVRDSLHRPHPYRPIL